MKSIHVTFAVLLLVSSGCSNTEAEKKDAAADENMTEQAELPSEKPEIVAANFLNAYAGYLTNNTANIPIDKWVDQCGMVTDEYRQKFKLVLATVDGDMGLEADPVMGAQDTPPQSFVAKSYDESTGTVVCSAGEGWDRPVLVKNVNGRWLVNGSGMVNMTAQ